MNLKEGTRRLALLLGAVGAILGGFASYGELRTILNQGGRLLAASDVIQIALYLILGFFIPWGAVRAIGWVGSGFVATSNSSESTFATDEDSSGQTKKERRSLVSRKAWIMILVLGLLATISNPVRGEDLSYMAGRFIGSLLLLAGVWALVVLVFRWISRKRPS
jgi:hypothetical protein